jgi:hypothetical protein
MMSQLKTLYSYAACHCMSFVRLFWFENSFHTFMIKIFVYTTISMCHASTLEVSIVSHSIPQNKYSTVCGTSMSPCYRYKRDMSYRKNMDTWRSKYWKKRYSHVLKDHILKEDHAKRSSKKLMVITNTRSRPRVHLTIVTTSILYGNL